MGGLVVFFSLTVGNTASYDITDSTLFLESYYTVNIAHNMCKSFKVLQLMIWSGQSYFLWRCIYRREGHLVSPFSGTKHFMTGSSRLGLARGSDHGVPTRKAAHLELTNNWHGSSELFVNHKSKDTHHSGTSVIQLNGTLGELGLFIEGVPAEVKGAVTEVTNVFISSSLNVLHDTKLKESNEGKDLEGSGYRNLEEVPE